MRLLRSGHAVEVTGVISPGRVRGMVIAGMLLVGVGVAGCGSSSTASTSTPAITKAAFVTQANAICGKADPLLSAAGAKLATQPSKTQVAALVRTAYVPSIQ